MHFPTGNPLVDTSGDLDLSAKVNTIRLCAVTKRCLTAASWIRKSRDSPRGAEKV